MILLDTSGVLAWINDANHEHVAVSGAMSEVAPPYLLSPFVLAEVDYMLRRWYRPDAQLAYLGQVESEAYRLEAFSASDIRQARRLIERHEGLGLSLADASIVVLAERHGVSDVLTFDQRDFRVLPGPGGRPFRLLPADA